MMGTCECLILTVVLDSKVSAVERGESGWLTIVDSCHTSKCGTVSCANFTQQCLYHLCTGQIQTRMLQVSPLRRPHFSGGTSSLRSFANMSKCFQF